MSCLISLHVFSAFFNSLFLKNSKCQKLCQFFYFLNFFWFGITIIFLLSFPRHFFKMVVLFNSFIINTNPSLHFIFLWLFYFILQHTKEFLQYFLLLLVFSLTLVVPAFCSVRSRYIINLVLIEYIYIY